MLCARTLRRYLTRPQRQVLLLLVAHPQLTHAQVGQVLGINRQSVSARLARANLRLARRGHRPLAVHRVLRAA